MDDIFLVCDSIKNMPEDVIYIDKGYIGIAVAQPLHENQIQFVSKDYLRQEKIDEQELLLKAIENTKRRFPCVIDELSSHSNVIDPFYTADEFFMPKMYLLSNEENFNATISLFTEHEKIQEFCKESDSCYTAIIPISKDFSIIAPLSQQAHIIDFEKIYCEYLNECAEQSIGPVFIYDDNDESVYTSEQGFFEFDLLSSKDSVQLRY